LSQYDYDGIGRFEDMIGEITLFDAVPRLVVAQIPSHHGTDLRHYYIVNIICSAMWVAVDYNDSMTRLTLLRHAKSSWSHSELSDIERPLNKRGKRDAPLMGRVCAERLPVPDLVVVSPAERTRTTVKLFLKAWDKHSPGTAVEPRIIVEDDLYMAGRQDWNRVVRRYSSEADPIVACGHQPGFGDYARWLSRAFDGEAPTTTVVSFRIESDGDAVLEFVGRPKEFSAE
jgi:phosphohistidine phosphatase